MAHVDHSGGARQDGAPPTNKTLLVLAGICLVIPLVALLWVSSYARVTPRLGGIPFFFWYQFLWVFITAGLTYAAHRLVLAARGLDSARPPRTARPPRGSTGSTGSAGPTETDGER
jgi:membrane protein implicated in regulation of membrane protease activity